LFFEFGEVGGRIFAQIWKSTRAGLGLSETRFSIFPKQDIGYMGFAKSYWGGQWAKPSWNSAEYQGAACIPHWPNFA
jgi:hypothetical protein